MGSTLSVVVNRLTKNVRLNNSYPAAEPPAPSDPGERREESQKTIPLKKTRQWNNIPDKKKKKGRKRTNKDFDTNDNVRPNYSPNKKTPPRLREKETKRSENSQHKNHLARRSVQREIRSGGKATESFLRSKSSRPRQRHANKHERKPPAIRPTRFIEDTPPLGSEEKSPRKNSVDVQI